MKVKVSTKELVAACTRVAGITQVSVVTINASDKGWLRVAAQGKTNMAAIKVKAEVEKAGAVSVEAQMFVTAIKSRAEVSLTEKQSKLIITGKSLNIELVTTPLEEVPGLAKKEGSTIDAALQEAFSKLVGRVSITNVHDQNPIGFRVRIDKTGMTVTAADDHHMASATMPSVKTKTPLKFTMAGGAFTLIDQLAGKDAYSLHFTDSELMVWSKTFELRIPTLADSGTGPSEEAVNSMIERLRSNKAENQVTVNIKEFYSVLDTLEAIFEAGANVQLETKEKGLSANFMTSYGKADAFMKAEKPKGKFRCEIDLPLARDAFNCIEGSDMRLQMIGDFAIYALDDTEDVKATYLLTMVTSKTGGTRKAK